MQICSNIVDLPIPGSPPKRTIEPFTIPPPRTLSSSAIPVLKRISSSALISLIVLVANKRKKAIHDLISDTVVIDMNYHVDIAIDVEEVTKEEKETTETTYFDSSSFNNTERKSLEKDED